MAKLKEIVIDCDLPSRVGRFWAAALDGYEVMPYDDTELARLAAIGLTPETDPTVMVDGPGPRFCFHLLQGERPVRNRIHFDIAASDREKEVQRLLSLGATFVRETDSYSVLNDPEGNNFCVTSE
ncbi:VOC family protein [Rhizobium hidalgonense]|uniref:VOC family protein n=1 Tax=Rhizobium hidalgonense TaxID=1538159 RepID=UPI000FEC9900|nr:VOC family protein [Rhizobium hidalgonense]RWX11880.1 VOC family protein [Rhizobium hidalgonense]